MAIPSFLFGGDTKETPQSIKQKRDLVRALMGASNAPKNLGEGLSAIGDGIVANVLDRRANRAEEAGTSAANQLFNSILGTTGGGASASAPTTGGAAPTYATPSDMTGNDVYNGFIDTVKTGVTNPFGLAAVAATGKVESGFSPGNVGRTWSDPSESGQPGTAGGIMSWRGPRYQALAATGDLSPAGQGKFFLQENPGLIKALNNAKSVDEAQQLMNNAWAFKGYNRPGNPNAANRLSLARGFLPSFQGQSGGQEVASLDPSAGMPPAQAAIAQQAAPSGGVDPGINISERRAPMQGPTQQAPALAPPTAVSAPPQVASQPPVMTQAPTPAAQPVQVAQNSRFGGVDPRLLQALQNPFLNEGQKATIQMLIQQQQGEADRAVQQQQWLQRQEYEQNQRQNDPAYKLGLQESQLKVDQLKNDPGETKVVNDRLVRTFRDGRVEDITPAAQNNPNGRFRFDGKSVEGQALNGLIDSGALTEGQAQQLAAGKQVTGPNGELLFLTPQSVFGGGQPAQQSQSVNLFPEPPQNQGVDLFPEQPAQQSAPQVAPGSAVPGAIPLTAPKAGESVEASQRATIAKQYGLDPNSDEGKRYIMTGTLPASDKGVTAGDREAVRTADDVAMAGQSALTLLNKAKELSGRSYEGAAASERAWLMSQFGDDTANNTREYDNILKEQALGQLKTIFGGSPTEGERAILLEIQGSSNQPIPVRNRIIDRAIQLVSNKIKFNQDRARELRSGTYYKPDANAPANGQRTVRKFNPATGELE